MDGTWKSLKKQPGSGWNMVLRFFLFLAQWMEHGNLVLFFFNRGTAFAFYNLTDDIGKGGGPWIVAALVVALDGKI